MKCILWIERHELGPRLHLFGRRIHEFQAGFTILAVSPVACIARSAYVSPWTAVTALAGFWLVVKDWPDLFPATRDKVSWRLGLHRLPREGNDASTGPLHRSQVSIRRRESSNRAAIATASTAGISTSSLTRLSTLYSTAVQETVPPAGFEPALRP